MTGRHASADTPPVRVISMDELSAEEARADEQSADEQGADAQSADAQSADAQRDPTRDTVADDDAVEAGIAILGGLPGLDEVAAITAVLAGVLEELAEEQGRRQLAGQSAWARSQRSLRTTLVPGNGHWRGFSA